MAECCREQAALDRVLFIPAATPPHKQPDALASCEDRLAMLQLAVGGQAAFEVLSDECDRGGISYTVETVLSLRARQPEDEFLLILGADALASLPSWRAPQQLLDLVPILALERRGVDDLATLMAAPSLQQLFSAAQARQVLADRIRVPAIDIRASRLRAAVAAGQSIRYRTPRAVECLIAGRGLYRSNSRLRQ